MTLSISVSDDSCRDTGSVTVSIEQVVARTAQFACTERGADKTLAITQGADIDSYIVEILLGWAVQYTCEIRCKSSVGNRAFLNAQISDWIGIHSIIRVAD